MNTAGRTFFGMLLVVAALGRCGAAWSAETAAPLVIADFESGARPFDQTTGKVVSENASHGRMALAFDKAGSLYADTSTGLPADWSAYDVLVMDVYNPTDKGLQLVVQARDVQEAPSYWAWHNRYIGIAPGWNKIEIPMADMWRGEVLRHDVEGYLDVSKMTRMVLTLDGPATIDYIRLEKFAAPKVEVKGLRAFDVGPVGSPLFDGFTALTEDDDYSKEKGYGWTRKNFYRTSDRILPDNLFRDWISCGASDFALDLPNGTYRVLMQLEDPGYWEFMQFYSARSVLAEGRTAVDETMNADRFKDRYFLNQDAEDMPGDDPFEKYVEPRQQWHEFDVEVKDGQLDLGFRSNDQYGCTLSALVVYPASEAAAGGRFMTYVKEMRRFDWAQRWKPLPSPAATAAAEKPTAEDSARGYRLYSVSPYLADSRLTLAALQAAPKPPVEALTAAAAKGEWEPVCFGLDPAKDLGRVDVTVSPLTSASGAALSADGVSVRVGRYRFTRQTNVGGFYLVRERELRLFNTTAANELDVRRGIPRRFWIILRAPDDAPAGEYHATVTVKPADGAPSQLPLTLTVLPFSLPEPKHLFALYGMEYLPQAYFPEMKAAAFDNNKALYRDLRDHGVNYDPYLDVRPRWDGGKVVITNADDIDRDVALRKEAGFIDGPVNLDGGCTAADLASGGPINGMPQKAFIEGYHKAITDTAAARGWPHPYFSFGDEPTVAKTLDDLTAAHNALHAVSPDIWTGIAYHVQSPESFTMQKTIDVHHLKDFLPPQQFIDAKPYAKLLLNCNLGSNRLAYGLHEWRATTERKTDGCITYSYTGCHIDIYYDLDGRESDTNKAPVRRDGTFDTTAQWEGIRAGIDDYRYGDAVAALASSATDASIAAEAKTLAGRAYEIGGSKDYSEGVAAAAAWRADAQKLLAKAAK